MAMEMWNINVMEGEYGLTFDENFEMNSFTIHFDNDETGVHGTMQFMPESRSAICFRYNSREDWTACIDNFDLYNTETGREVWEAFHCFNLGRMYRAAKKFTMENI